MPEKCHVFTLPDLAHFHAVADIFFKLKKTLLRGTSLPEPELPPRLTLPPSPLRRMLGMQVRIEGPAPALAPRGPAAAPTPALPPRVVPAPTHLRLLSKP